MLYVWSWLALLVYVVSLTAVVARVVLERDLSALLPAALVAILFPLLFRLVATVASKVNGLPLD
ncbi:MAG TPA: hypothetical protein VNT01_00395 [Symbiobacteriaceae bacterium]|nr:hypothetical protein [Symbiobacteriaceae bacterium]